MMTDFVVEKKEIIAETWTYLAIGGRLDAVTAAEAEKRICAGWEESQKLVLDLAKVEYISSAGLRILRRLAQIAKTQGKELCLMQVHSLVREMLRDSGMEVFFQFVDHVEELGICGKIAEEAEEKERLCV